MRRRSQQATYNTMAFTEGGIDNDGRFELFAADMRPYRSGADIDAGPRDRCCRRTPTTPDAPQIYANTLQLRDAAGVFPVSSQTGMPNPAS